MHARNFAEAIHGSALLYNLMLAEKKKDAERITGYKTAFHDWAALMRSKQAALNAWTRADFWQLVHGTGARISRGTEAFVTVWLDKVIGKDASALEHSKSARTLITERERLLKGGLARLTNARALDLWGGASSSERLAWSSRKSAQETCTPAA